MVEPVDVAGPQGELAAGGVAVLVGEEGVVPERGGERALGHADGDDQVEVDPDAHRHRPDQHAFAEPADAAEVRFELDGERAGEHVEADRTFEVVEHRQPVEREDQALGGAALGFGPGGAPGRAAEDVGQQPLGPADAVAPGGRGFGAGEPVGQPEHEPAQVDRPVGILPVADDAPVRVLVLDRFQLDPVGLLGEPVGVVLEAQVPVGPAGDDSGFAGDALPRRGGRPLPVVEDGRARQPGEDVLAAEPGGGQGQQAEQRAAGEAPGEGEGGGAVGDDVGCVEVVLEQPSVRFLGGVEHGDAVERGAGPDGIDHGPNGRADLVVGVRRGDDAGGLGGDQLGEDRVGGRRSEVEPEPGDGPDDFGIGLGHPGGTGEDAELRCGRPGPAAAPPRAGTGAGGGGRRPRRCPRGGPSGTAAVAAAP